MNKNLDPESQELWNELRVMEEGCPSCQIVLENIKKGLTHITYFQFGFLVQKVEILYCPKCGKRLE
jgi:hypothetical protein